MSRFVRSSKYRHIFGRPTRKEQCYDNLHISKNAWDSNIIKANTQYLSVNWESSGGGAFAVVPLGHRGRLPEQIPLFRGHTAAVLDTDWNPFNDNIIASGSDDGKVFLWAVPEGFTMLSDEETGPKDVSPVRKLAGHSRKVGHVLFHPAAQNVLATSSGDFTVKLWDIETGQAHLTQSHNDIVQNMSFSGNGNLLATTCRDKKFRIWDLRQEKPAHEGPGHAGAKTSRVVWLGELDRVATTGFSKMSDRQLGLWDIRSCGEPIGGFQMLDSISGVCMPFWDDGTKCLYLAGKGDGNIRYYEYANDEFVYLSEYKSADPQRGIAFLPKRGVALHENEVQRGFKTVNDTYIEPISFIVPRRSETFQSDIYPETVSGHPGLSSADWFSGKEAFPPKIDLANLYSEDGSVQALQSPNTQPTTGSFFEQATETIKSITPSLSTIKETINKPIQVATSPQNSANNSETAKPVVRQPSPAAARSNDNDRRESVAFTARKPSFDRSSELISRSNDSAKQKDHDINTSVRASTQTTSSTSDETLSQILKLLEAQTRTLASHEEKMTQLIQEVSELKTRLVETTKKVESTAAYDKPNPPTETIIVRVESPTGSDTEFVMASTVHNDEVNG